MKDDSAVSGVFVAIQPSPPRPGEDRTPIPRGRPREDRYGRGDPSRAWTGFPLTAPSWEHGSVPVLARDEVLSVHALLTLAVVSCRGWGELAGRTDNVELRWTLERHAQLRDECANELQKLLCEAGADVGYPRAIFGRSAGAAARTGATLDGSALAKSLNDLGAHERKLTRKYEELLLSASPELHAVLVRQWRQSQEIDEALNSALHACLTKGEKHPRFEGK